MPAGWVVVRRDVEDPGRQYKRYKSPQGQMFASYGQAQQYWERVGSMVGCAVHCSVHGHVGDVHTPCTRSSGQVLLDAVPPVELIPASAAPAVADTTADGDISGDVPLDEAVGARAGEDGEVDVIQPLHNVGERKYLPSMYVGASSQGTGLAGRCNSSIVLSAQCVHTFATMCCIPFVPTQHPPVHGGHWTMYDRASQ